MSVVWVDDDTVHVDDVNVEVGVRYFGLTAGAIASGFTEFGGGSNLSGWVSDFLLWSTANLCYCHPWKRKIITFVLYLSKMIKLNIKFRGYVTCINNRYIAYLIIKFYEKIVF